MTQKFTERAARDRKAGKGGGNTSGGICITGSHSLMRGKPRCKKKKGPQARKKKKGEGA